MVPSLPNHLGYQTSYLLANHPHGKNSAIQESSPNQENENFASQPIDARLVRPV